MPGRGGARPGAGRKRGEGQKKRHAEFLASGERLVLSIRERIAAGELGDPLEILIRFATDRKLQPHHRIAAASMAVKFVHPLLSAVAIQHLNGGGTDRQAQIGAFMRRLEALVPQIEGQAQISDDAHNFAQAVVRVSLFDRLKGSTP